MNQKSKGPFKFSVIAGRLKGRVITTPNLGITRPPLSRLRRAIFDFLQVYLDGAVYLDLFSGTGSYLFEAVSRGAARAIGVEAETRLVDAINKQATRLGVAGQLECICDDVFKAIPRFADGKLCFDIVMLAPPQYKGLVNRTLVTLRAHRVMSPDGMIIAQHDTSETGSLDLSGYTLAQSRRYGNTTFSVLTM